MSRNLYFSPTDSSGPKDAQVQSYSSGDANVPSLEDTLPSPVEEDWTLNLQARCVTDVIYFDFKKAFDTVCHNKLLSKLKSYGICGNLLSWIKAFLCGRSQSVRIGEAISAAVPVISGVP